MELENKLIDFLTVEDGSIAKKSMMLTGAILAASVLGEVAHSATAGCDCGNCCPCHKEGTHSNMASNC